MSLINICLLSILSAFLSYPLGILLQRLYLKLIYSKRSDIEDAGFELKADLFWSRYSWGLMSFVILIVGVIISTKSMFLSFFTVCFFIQLLFISVLDYNYQYIFDVENLVLLGTGLLYLPFNVLSLQNIFMSSIIVFLLMYFFYFMSYKITGVCMLGGGDVKLLGVLGIWLGKTVIDCLLVGCTIAGIYSLFLLVQRLVKKNKEVQYFGYGPFLCFGAVCAWLFNFCR